MSAGDPTAGGRTGTIYPIVRLVAALLLMTVGACAMYATIVALKPVSVEFGVSRGVASLPYMLFMLGFGLGSVVMGRVTDRFGLLPPALIASLALPAGLVAAARADAIWQLCLAVGVLAGFLGAAATFAPVISDISHWFVRRRGLALAVVVSGTYLAGALWPPILQYFIDSHGWRETFVGFGIFALCVMLPLSAFLYRRPPVTPDPVAPGGAAEAHRPLGFAPSTLQCLICAAGIGCCAAMAMPQVHIVAYATDLGYAPARGAEMLSLMLGCGILSRLASGWISDRIGGLRTLLLGSTLQALVLAAFLTGDTLSALYALSIAFGLAQGGIVPSYAMIIRAYFPAGQSGSRIGAALLFTMIGMALGGWMAGALYDLTGSYDASFVNAVAFNLANMAIAAGLLRRARSRQGELPARQPA
jgi:MFS family permease